MKKRNRVQQHTVIFAIVTVCLMLIAGIWLADTVCRLFHKPQKIIIIDERIFSEEPIISAEESVQYETQLDNSQMLDAKNITIQKADIGVPQGYTIIQKQQNSIHSGQLLQLDNYHTFTGTIGTFSGFDRKSNSYRLKNMTLQIQDSVVDAMNEMADAYSDFSGKDDLMIYSTTEVYTAEGSLYPDILPDRSTGYCVDLAFLNADGSISRITDINNGWLKENAYHFGFVFSYTETNQNETGVVPAPYHLRYVGKAHACLMHDSQMDFNTYLNALQSYTVGNSYSYEAYNMSIYYVKAETSGMTNVPVPDDRRYDISGNNTDGYIICVYDEIN